MKGKTLIKTILLAGGFIFLLLLGIYSQESLYRLHITTALFINIILVSSLWLIFTTGELSLAHTGFMAVGAYGSGVLVMRLGLSFWLVFPFVGILCAILSLLIGFPALRLKGFAFFIVTLAFAGVIMTIFSNFWPGIFGSATGLIGVPSPSPIPLPGGHSIDFASKVSQYYLGFIIMIFTVLVIYLINRSRYGHISKAMAQSDILAKTLGVDVMRHKLLMFSAGGFFAGLAGSLYAHFFHVVAPLDFSVHHTILLAAMIIVGGRNSMFGPIIGAILFTILNIYLSPLGPLEELVTGTILVLVMLFFPEGLISVPTLLMGKVKRI